MKEAEKPLMDQEKKDKDNKKADKGEDNEDIKPKEKSFFDFLYGASLFGRIIFTLYSFHGLFFIYNLIIQYVIAFPSLLYNGLVPKWAYIPFDIFYFLFAFNTSNILIIPTFECFSFPFLFYKQPFAHIISFVTTFKEQKYNIEDAKKNYNKYTTIFLIVVEIFYAVGLFYAYLKSDVNIKDIVKMVILVLVYVYYLIIILSYFTFSLYIIYIIIIDWREEKSIRKIINSNFKGKEISNLNLFSNIINPFIVENYIDKDKNKLKDDGEEEKKPYFENGCFEVMTYSKILTFIFSLVCFFVFAINLLSYWLDHVFFFLFYLIITILTLTLNFPLCYRNRKTYGTFGSCCCCEKGNNFIISDISYKNKSNHPNLVSFSKLLSNVILLAAAIVFVYKYHFTQETSIQNSMFFKGIVPSKETIDTKTILMPNICYSSIHSMPLALFLPFINDAYYYGNIKSEENEKKYKSSFEIEEYMKLFFDEDYEINVRGNLVNKKDSVTMVQYNVKNKKDYLTILSIKGTSISLDLYLDAQLYLSSIFLSILSSFSLSTQKDSYTFKFIEYGLSIPYRIFFRLLIIDKYMNDLKNAFVDNEYSFFNNVVIVGHSLGGGLAKLFGRFIGKQAISLSGPGINAFHSLWNYERSSENFEISAIDLVPDMDLVPRVEVSGGTIYRIICKSGIFDCHGKELSLCEVLIMCRYPIYESFCQIQAKLSPNDIEIIKEGSELN